jgi:hypothetical protein
LIDSSHISIFNIISIGTCFVDGWNTAFTLMIA